MGDNGDCLGWGNVNPLIPTARNGNLHNQVTISRVCPEMQGHPPISSITCSGKHSSTNRCARLMVGQRTSPLRK
jgi:hypothetical protein